MGGFVACELLESGVWDLLLSARGRFFYCYPFLFSLFVSFQLSIDVLLQLDHPHRELHS